MSVFHKTNDVLIVDTFKNVFQRRSSESGREKDTEAKADLRRLRMMWTVAPPYFHLRTQPPTFHWST